MRKHAFDTILIVLFALLTAVGAAIKIPFLPYHPITPQIIFVLLSGALLGAFRGSLSQLLFVVLGLLGLPLFRELAPAYPVPALGASPEFLRIGLKAGWLLGFIAAAYVTGAALEYAREVDLWSLTTALTGGLAVLYLLGIFFPVLVFGRPLTPAFLKWVGPFLAMDCVKAVLTLIFLANLERIRTLSPAV